MCNFQINKWEKVNEEKKGCYQSKNREEGKKKISIQKAEKNNTK